MKPTAIKANVLFTIDLKVSGQMLSIPVYEGENQQQLVKRFCEEHVFKSDYKEAIKTKIIESLLATIKKAGVSAALKKKVNAFLSQDEQSLSYASKEKSEPSLKHSNISTPFKQLINQSNPQSSQRKSVAALVNKSKKDSSDQSKADEPRLASKPSCIRRNKREPVYHPNPHNSLNCSKKSCQSVKAIDSDLVAAYETILKKSKEPQIKIMAKKYLQQVGYLLKQPRSN